MGYVATGRRPNQRVAVRENSDPTARLLRDLFPGPNRTARLCRAFERSRTSMEEIMAGRKVPRDVRLIVGLLAACPIEEWPQRWRDARLPDAIDPLIFPGYRKAAPHNQDRR